MEIIDKPLLKSNIQIPENKNINSVQCKHTMYEFFKIQNNTYKHITTKFKIHEASASIISRDNYINRKAWANKKSFSKGLILYCDFGSNYRNEIAYQHPCVVISQTTYKLFVVPTSSGRLNKAFKSDGDIYDEYVEGNTADGFSKRCCLLLNDAQWISKSRIINDYNSKQKVSSAFIQNVEEKLFKLIMKEKFRNFNYYKKRSDSYTKLQDELSEKDKIIKELRNQLEELDKEKSTN